MEKTVALTRLEPLRPLDPCVLPRYFTNALATRTKARSDALTEAVGKGIGATFFTFVAVVCTYLTGLLLGSGYPLPVMALVTVVCAGASFFLAAKDGWACLERAQYLRGTRDETKYLPAGCRAHAADEVRLTDALFDANDDVFRWNETLPLLEVHGTPYLRAIAAVNREKLEKRQRVVVAETGRLWSLAGTDGTKALPPADS